MNSNGSTNKRPEGRKEADKRQEETREQLRGWGRTIERVCADLMEFRAVLLSNFERDQETFTQLERVFAGVQPLAQLCHRLMGSVDDRRLGDVLCGHEMRAILDQYRYFFNQNSLHTQWIAQFLETNPAGRQLCLNTAATIRNRNPNDYKDPISLDCCFYLAASGLFSLERIVDRYIQCLDDSEESLEKALSIKSLMSDVLKTDPVIWDQKTFFTTQKEWSRIANKTRSIKISTRFIHKEEVVKLSRKDDKPLPRLLILFSDCLYVTTRPGNVSDKYNVRNEISLDAITISRVSEDENRNGSLKWGLNISAREICQDFYFKNEQVMNAWIMKLRLGVGNRNIKFDEKIQSNYPPAHLGEQAPYWQKISATKYCNGIECLQTFSANSRRHHCRADGLLYCGHCCSSKMKLKFERASSSRVCDLCFYILNAGCMASKMQEVKRKLDSVFERKTRKGKLFGWLTVRKYDKDRREFKQPLQYFVELDVKDPIMKMYVREEDKLDDFQIMLFGMRLKVGRQSNYFRRIMSDQFILEHQLNDEIYLFDAGTDENCNKWVKCLEDTIRHIDSVL